MVPSTNINPSYRETDVGLTLVICFIICCDPHQLQEFSSTACLLLRKLCRNSVLGKNALYLCVQIGHFETWQAQQNFSLNVIPMQCFPAWTRLEILQSVSAPSPRLSFSVNFESKQSRCASKYPHMKTQCQERQQGKATAGSTRAAFPTTRSK